MSNYPPGPYPQRYEDSHFYEQDRRKMEGGKHAQTSLILGIVSSALGVMFGWIPFLGLLAVGGAVGCGIPALLQAKKAEVYNVSGRAGFVLGWIGIAAAIGWTAIYVILIIVGGASGSAHTFVSN